MEEKVKRIRVGTAEITSLISGEYKIESDGTGKIAYHGEVLKVGDTIIFEHRGAKSVKAYKVKIEDAGKEIGKYLAHFVPDGEVKVVQVPAVEFTLIKSGEYTLEIDKIGKFKYNDVILTVGDMIIFANRGIIMEQECVVTVENAGKKIGKEHVRFAPVNQK